MIFVSKYGAYKVTAKHETYDRINRIGLNDGFTVEFQPDVLTAHMNLLRGLEAEGRVKFNGQGRDASTNQNLDPAERCSSFDTATIRDPKLRKEVEDALMARPTFGTDFWLYEESAPQAPWPAYDKLVPQGRRTAEMVAEKIGLMTLDMGLNPADVLAYEKQNANRDDVIAVLEALTQAEAEEQLIQA